MYNKFHTLTTSVEQNQLSPDAKARSQPRYKYNARNKFQ